MMGMVRRGLAMLVRPERVEALLWTRLRLERRQEAREPLFNRYVGFARSIAYRQRPYGQSGVRKDAEQWAYEGLLEAIDTFDPLRGSPFEAFARPRIVGSVRDGFAKHSELDAQRSQQRRIERERLRSLKERADSESREDAITALARIAAGLAIGLMLDGTRLLASEDDPDPAPDAYETLAWRQMQKRLCDEIDRLSANEATVVRQHYIHGLNFAQVADLMSLSRGRISQLHSAALIKLKKRLSREY